MDGGYIGRGELIDWKIVVNLMANILNKNRWENKQCITRSGSSKKRCDR